MCLPRLDILNSYSIQIKCIYFHIKLYIKITTRKIKKRKDNYGVIDRRANRV